MTGNLNIFKFKQAQRAKTSLKKHISKDSSKFLFHSVRLLLTLDTGEPHFNLIKESPIYAMRTRLHAKSLQSSPTLCDPMDCSPPGSSVHGISQARTLEWVAMHSSPFMQ